MLTIISEWRMMNNVVAMSELLFNLLNQKLGKHPNVGDIRGRGLFIGVGVSINTTCRCSQAKLISRLNSSKTRSRKSHSILRLKSQRLYSRKVLSLALESLFIQEVALWTADQAITFSLLHHTTSRGKTSNRLFN